VSGPQPFVFNAGAEVKRHAPATERNRDAIASVLATLLPEHGKVLEIASGTGEHVVHFAKLFPGLTWQPSDPDPIAIASIEAWRADSDVPNVLPAMLLDARLDWPVTEVDAIICINMLHISPWEATLGLLRNAARVLAPAGVLYIYGPFRQHGTLLAESNVAFDMSLRQQDAAWGLRYVEDVAEVARGEGLRLYALENMPANNLSLIFRG
jgi:SAM-dependent methyltransferase